MNHGALAGRYALRDLSNTNKFTNCLNTTPVRQDIELITGSVIENKLRVKAGSTFVVPHSKDFIDYVSISEDLEYTFIGGFPDLPNQINIDGVERVEDPNFYRYVVYNASEGRLEVAPYVLDDEGVPMYANKSYFKYQSVNNPDRNIIAGTFTNNLAVPQLCSLPIGYFDKNNNFTSFSGFGFYNYVEDDVNKSIFWVDAGTNISVAKGRTNEYTLASKSHTINKLKITVIDENSDLFLGNVAESVIENGTFHFKMVDGILLLKPSGDIALAKQYKSGLHYDEFDGCLYAADENYLYYPGRSVFDGIKLLQFDYDNGAFSTFKNINTYQQIDFSETMQQIQDIEDSVLHVTGKEDEVEYVHGNKYFYDEVEFEHVTVQDMTVPSIMDMESMTPEEKAYAFENYGKQVGYEYDKNGELIQPFGPFKEGDIINQPNITVKGLTTIESPDPVAYVPNWATQGEDKLIFSDGKVYLNGKFYYLNGLEYTGSQNAIKAYIATSLDAKVDEYVLDPVKGYYYRTEKLDPDEPINTYHEYRSELEDNLLISEDGRFYYAIENPDGDDPEYIKGEEYLGVVKDIVTYTDNFEPPHNLTYTGDGYTRIVTLTSSDGETWTSSKGETFNKNDMYFSYYDDIWNNKGAQKLIPGDGSSEFIESTTPLTIQDAIEGLNPAYPYAGQYGGLHIKTDAYLVSMGTTGSNCFNLVGATQAGNAGIVFGSERKFKLHANHKDSTFELTMPENSSVKPTDNLRYDIGTTNNRFKNVYAQTFDGVATRTMWADLAEVYKTDFTYPIGTLVKFGGSEEMTLADDECNAVISDTPANLMNSQMEGQPIALVGRVKVRAVGAVKKHDKLVLAFPGVAASVGLKYNGDKAVIARALEDKDYAEEGLVLCAVQFRL